nr:ceramidase domain-containing protein [uncultured Cohaesibacter sp.]
MNMHSPIDIYCERTDASYWSEPVNALTNLSFILAALWAYWTYRKLKRQEGQAAHSDLPVLVAIVMAGLIGIGSYLFHTHATVWSSLVDVIPIWTFVAYYLFLAMYRIMGLPLWRAARVYGITLVSIAGVLWLVSTAFLASDGAQASSDGLNGSTQYLPGMIALYGFALVMLIRRHPAMGWILAAAVTFSVSIFFRTIDMMVCDALPLGTHFLWHSLNGLFIGFLLQALVRYGRAKPHIST